MPLVAVFPTHGETATAESSEEAYVCPVYRTVDRPARDLLGSSKVVDNTAAITDMLVVPLPSPGTPRDVWVRAGAAIILNPYV